MYTQRQLDLCARIRDHCRSRQWYGPDGVNPWLSRVQELNAHEFDWATGQVGTRDLWDDSRLTGFAFPPATEAQLAATERELGYPLPEMLRALYSQVANGGFGPGLGISGTGDGYQYERDLENRPSEIRPEVAKVYESIHWRLDWLSGRANPLGTQLFDLAEYEAAHGMTTRLLLAPSTWPSRFLYLVEWGCAMRSCVDAGSGRVYFADVWDVVEDGPDQRADELIELYLDSFSLEDWLENWMRMDHGEPDSSPQALTKHMNDIPIVTFIPPDHEPSA